jgi:hypothetical protein
MAQALPVKNAEQQWAVWDSTRLNNFPFRDDDIIIGTWSKSGTTWTQQLVAQLVFRGGSRSLRPDAVALAGVSHCTYRSRL